MGPWFRRTFGHPASAVLAAVGLRWLLLGVWEVELVQDARGYWLLAGSILQGDGLSVDGRPTALRLPGYPLFVASIRAWAGNRPEAVVAVQALLAGWNTWLVGRLAARWSVGFHPAASAMAAWAWALYPYGFAYSHRLITEVPSSTLMLLMAHACSLRGTVVRSVTLGALGAIVVYFKPSFLLFLPCLFAWEALRTGRLGLPLRAATVALLTFALCYVPWPIRNQLVFDRFILGATNFGQSLFNGVYGAGTLGHPWDYDAAEYGPGGASMEERRSREALLKGVRELPQWERNRALAEISMQLIRDDPLRFVRNMVLTVPRLWLRFPWENPPTLRGLLGTAVQMLWLMAALAGTLCLHRSSAKSDSDSAQRTARFAQAVVLYTTGVHLITTPVVRYSYPAMAILCGFIGQLAMRETSPRPRQAHP